jgi:dephospho-CoA kinase
MQKLTKRGMELAETFRKLGIPVIESYPGAAQDIMKIPRKRASLEYLEKGLANLGIEGEYTRQTVSHDELDAITSALVGLFFWSGRFERLGTIEEDYLIIPDLNVETFNWVRRQTFGFCGPIASGKTTASRFLEKRDFVYKRFSQTLAQLLIEHGVEPTRRNLQEFGDQVNQEKGQRWLARKMLSDLPPEKENIVIDGLRFPEDIAFMIETFGPGFSCIFISAPHEIRKKRYVELGYRPEEFEEATQHPVERKVSELHSLAHMSIENSNGLPDFQNKIDGLSEQKRELCL